MQLGFFLCLFYLFNILHVTPYLNSPLITTALLLVQIHPQRRWLYFYGFSILQYLLWREGHFVQNSFDFSISLTSYLIGAAFLIALNQVRLLRQLPALLAPLLAAAVLGLWGFGPWQISSSFAIQVIAEVCILVWPLAWIHHDLKTNDTAVITLQQQLATLSPLWNIRLFQSIPLHKGPLYLIKQEQKQTHASLQDNLKSAQKIMSWALVFALGKILLDLLVWGQIPFSSKLLWNSPLPHRISLASLEQLKTPLLRWALLFAHFYDFLLNLLAVTMAAIAIAHAMGFKIHLNTYIKSGNDFVTGWDRLMYYLNQIIVEMFYKPTYRFLRVVKNRKARLILSIFTSVLGFGLLYFILLNASGFIRNPYEIISKIPGRIGYLLLVGLLSSTRLFIKIPDGVWLQNWFTKWIFRPFLITLLLFPLLSFALITTSTPITSAEALYFVELLTSTR